MSDATLHLIFEVVLWVFGLLIAIVGFFLSRIVKQLDRVVKNLDDHKLYSAQNYLDKIDFNRVMDKFEATLLRIENKLDKKEDK